MHTNQKGWKNIWIKKEEKCNLALCNQDETKSKLNKKLREDALNRTQHTKVWMKNEE